MEQTSTVEKMGYRSDLKCILLTNDDGFLADGLGAIRKELSRRWDVVVIAPDRERSAVSHSLTLHRPLRANQIDSATFVVDGTPTDCVMLGVWGILETKPDLVVSGINHGPNLGDDVTYSGTVGAAIEGALLGIPSIAVSIADYQPSSFEGAAVFGRALAEQVLSRGIPAGTFLNVNVPNLPAHEIQGVRVTTLGKRVYRSPVVRRTDPRGRTYYWIGGQDSQWTGGEDSDFAAIEAGMMSVSPLQLDLTSHCAISEIKGWNIDWKGGTGNSDVEAAV